MKQMFWDVVASQATSLCPVCVCVYKVLCVCMCVCVCTYVVRGQGGMEEGRNNLA